MGNELRLQKGLSYLVEAAVEHANGLADNTDFLIIDGIRNTGEVRWLKETYGYRFYLLAVDAREEERWRRSRGYYDSRNLRELDYQHDDDRDKDEETPYGQQVQLCVDLADVLIVNDDQISTGARPRRLGARVASYVKLVAGLESRYPTSDETIMNVAYAASNSTKCLKRQVGAVIVAPSGEPISIGFNENPMGTHPCVIEYGECYRDVIRNETFRQLNQSNTNCPNCGNALGVLIGPPWRCEHCHKAIEKTFFPDRAMNWCTAIHAEERAILNAAGRDLHGCTMYSTTFPCFLCSQKIAHAGIKEVVFSEPYPDILAAGRLEIAEIAIRRFEGIRSYAFHRLFARARQEEEERINKERAESS
jgi:deoxycytidylate deaminase